MGGYTGLHLSVVLFIHLSFCLSVLFCSLHKAVYIKSVTAGVKSDFLTVLVRPGKFERLKKTGKLKINGGGSLQKMYLFC